jgi:hypothetical protein
MDRQFTLQSLNLFANVILYLIRLPIVEKENGASPERTNQHFEI